MSPTTALLDRLDAAGCLELQFLQHRTTGRVNVVVPTEPVWLDSGEPRPVTVDEVIRLGVGAVPTLCGYRGRRHLGGCEQGDQLVSEFADELLCGGCYRALGPHCARAFEHRQADPDAAESTGEGA